MMNYIPVVVAGLISVMAMTVWPVGSAQAHPIDMTSVEFFTEADWAGTPVPERTMRGVHTLNWLEALALIDTPGEASEILANLPEHELQLRTYLEENLTVTNQDSACELINVSLPPQTIDEVIISGLYLLFDVRCTSPLHVVSIEATFLTDKFPDQTNYVGVYRMPTALIGDTTLTPEITNWKLAVATTTLSTPTDSVLPVLTTADLTYADRVMGWLPGLLERGTPLTILMVLGAVFLIGLLHTLEAGHSKVILASLMLEKRVDFKKGVWYVVVFTLTHVADIIIIGLALLALSSVYETAALFAEIERVAYVLLLGMGVYLFFKAFGEIVRVRMRHQYEHRHEHNHADEHHHAHSPAHTDPHTHEHHHDHSHEHHNHHGHSHTPQGATLREQLTIAFLTGLAPCLMGWSVLLLILAAGQVWLIVPAVGVFGLGIGVGLFLVMLATVYIKDQVHGRFRAIGLYAPLASAVVLVLTALWLLV